MFLGIFFHGFWSGFQDKTNPVHVEFFLQLFEKVYNAKVYSTTSFEIADILVENTQVHDSLRTRKEWKQTYLYSGESYLRHDADKYDCVLYGERTHKNFVNVPLYIPYLYCMKAESLFETNHFRPTEIVPPNDVVVVIGNPNGSIRNQFLDELEKEMKVVYAGNFRKNVDVNLSMKYNELTFYQFISQFKFIITMENSEHDTYITEKITHAIFARNIPVYWGSQRVTDYFNPNRFLHLRNPGEIKDIVHKMKYMSDEEWLFRVNSSIFSQFGQIYTINFIADQIKNVIFPRPFPLVDQIILLCNPEFEPERYKRLVTMLQHIGAEPYHCKFICPTYKHTITPNIYNMFVKQDLVTRIRHLPTKRAELSLTLNSRSAYEFMERMYSDGVFLVFESDVFLKENWKDFNKCLEKLRGKDWSCVHVGGVDYPIGIPYIEGPTPYRGPVSREEKITFFENSAEDLSSPGDEIRFVRKFHTRCTDSLLFTYKGLTQLLYQLRTDTNYAAPFDYYIINLAEKNMEFKHYWSTVTYFDQASNRGLDASTVQTNSY